MRKKFLAFLVIFLFAGIGTTFGGDLKIELACPTSVRVGQPLTVAVYLENHNCEDYETVNRVMMGLAGNPDGTLGGAGIWGPYNRPFSTPRIVPPANCITNTPGTVPQFPLTIISSVPASLSGKMAMAYVVSITPAGKTRGGGQCLVAVNP